MTDKLIVTFHRTYEVEMDKIQYRGRNDYSDKELEDEKIQAKIAEEIARDWLADEMPEFIDNTKDFVSATIVKPDGTNII